MLHIIGLGVSDTARLSDEAVIALQSCDAVYGSDRQLATVSGYLVTGSKDASFSGGVICTESARCPESRAGTDAVGTDKTAYLNDNSVSHPAVSIPDLCALPRLTELKDQLTDRLSDDQTICVLASGDPLFFGIGRWLKQHFEQWGISFYPAVSSIQAACHKLGLSLQDVQVVSLHGRPLISLRRHLKQNQTLVMLTDKHSYPESIVQECLTAGFTGFTLTVCEDMGYPQERVTTVEVSSEQQIDLSALSDVSPLHVSVLQLKQVRTELAQSSQTQSEQSQPDRVYLPEFPGIPDQHFITDGPAGKGMITKREVRLNILSLLQLAKGDVLWDIGAGCGGVAVELSYWQPGAEVWAIEHHPERLVCLEANRERFGVVSNLKVVTGRAPEALYDLPTANKTFIGGSDGELPKLLDLCWQQLPDQGVLVASAVTENTRQHLLNFYQQRQQATDAQLDTLQVAISKGAELAGQLMYRPTLPVTLFRFEKQTVVEKKAQPEKQTIDDNYQGRAND
ncbi:precorrin-6y C5,15-methyltransferase (decarboxylating) subunit CbiE [Oceanospirillum beijerinckii]|uniref:precorrin-6y C5,15-methyltransferase (decarboxylating) subunit CbiE n=1 Tax=Oceanospirillum beijerinckii TaxID=64976 RepID=UPI0003FA72C2|nr:precorrin-6y C5,15-methyltransferase (decarboxylating) subunit CbiE [Oceanospirillum beijerinckii]